MTGPREGIHLNKAKKKTYFVLTKYFRSKLLTRKTEVRLYGVIIIRTLTYFCETWTITSQRERKLKTFDNKIRRRIYGRLQ